MPSMPLARFVVGTLWSGVARFASTRHGGPPRQRQALERLRRGDLVQQMPINVEDRHAVVALGDDMGVPDLVVDGLSDHGRLSVG